jgi:hypothetical protein
MDLPARFRFRPRYRALALGSVGLGAMAAIGGLVTAGTPLIVIGGAAIVLGVLYLASPAWRLVVVIDDDALEVTSGSARRFRLPWADVTRVVTSPTTATCFVDGGAPERSLLVPGVGAPAPYEIEDRAALVAAIVARVPAERVQTVGLLEQA